MTPNPLKTVWEIAEQTMENAQYVMMLDKNIEKIAKNIKNTSFEPIGMPDVPLGEDINSGLILYELHAAAVNYCYWYGKHDVRPNNAGATKMYQLLDEAYKEAVKIIKQQRKKLDAVAKALLEKETLDREAFEKIVGKKKEKSIDK